MPEISWFVREKLRERHKRERAARAALPRPFETDPTVTYIPKPGPKYCRARYINEPPWVLFKETTNGETQEAQSLGKPDNDGYHSWNEETEESEFVMIDIPGRDAPMRQRSPRAGEMMQPSEVAEKAIEVLDERGRCQKKMMDEDGSVCLLGAIAVAQGIPLTRDWGTHEAITYLVPASRAVIDEILHSVDAESSVVMPILSVEHGTTTGMTRRLRTLRMSS